MFQRQLRLGRGDRVRLLRSRDPWARVGPGDEGTVLATEGDVVQVEWDSGWIMPMYACPGGDELERVQDQASARRVPSTS